MMSLSEEVLTSLVILDFLLSFILLSWFLNQINKLYSRTF